MVAQVITVVLGTVMGVLVLHMLHVAWRIRKTPSIKFEEGSLEIQMFESMGYDNWVEDYFTDQFNKTNKVANRRQYKYMFKTVFWGAIAYACGYWPLVAVIGSYYFVIAMLDKFLMNYYFWTYYEVEAELRESDDEDE